MGTPVSGVVSIVVPIYNVQDFLRPCLESLLLQSYTDLEIIAVDDGSTDDSAMIVDEFAARDPRVRALHKPNGGLSDARNAGLDVAHGEFVICVDGDDVLLPCHVGDLITAAREFDASIVVGGFRRILPSAANDSRPHQQREALSLSTTEALEQLFYQTSITTSAWGKLYRRELFEGIRYPVGAIHEDLPVTYRLIARASRVAVVGCQSYLYVQRPASITGSRQINRRLEALSFANQAVEFAAHAAPSLTRAAKVRQFMEGVYILGQAEAAEVQSGASEALAVLVSERSVVLRDPRAPVVARVYGLLAYFGPRAVRTAFWAQSRLSYLKQRKL